MARTSNIFARVEPSVKEQAELILSELGLPMSNAVSLFLKQVILQRGIPFEMKLPKTTPLCLEKLTISELDTEIDKGLYDIENGNFHSFDSIVAELEQDYKI